MKSSYIIQFKDLSYGMWHSEAEFDTLKSALEDYNCRRSLMPQDFQSRMRLIYTQYEVITQG